MPQSTAHLQGGKYVPWAPFSGEPMNWPSMFSDGDGCVNASNASAGRLRHGRQGSRGLQIPETMPRYSCGVIGVIGIFRQVCAEHRAGGCRSAAIHLIFLAWYPCPSAGEYTRSSTTRPVLSLTKVERAIGLTPPPRLKNVSALSGNSSVGESSQEP